MVPASKEEAIAGLERVWGDSPETRVGHAIIDLVAQHLDNSFLPLSLFYEAAEGLHSNEDDAVLNVVNFLAGAGSQLLTLHLEYIDEDTVISLEDDQARDAAERNINPVTGDLDEELPTKLFLCFAPSDVARRVLRA